ncbi:leucyl aminopeptidase family protein [Rubrivirga marina]|uniref:Probable cytosol aminopeptidase n=1 Tax=Rubrivirga marina TaxID=1196024 RepID=A0A271J3X5_9BACT|nr:leucyl aminopeptidase family protein [Rubrivirga marina]PAP77655.1 hypothetical protein BSZ37_15010 [Rubrivirga marina]
MTSTSFLDSDVRGVEVVVLADEGPLPDVPEAASALAIAEKTKAPVISPAAGRSPIVFVRLGDEPGLERWRWAAASAAGLVASLEAEEATLRLPEEAPPEVAAALVEGFRLGAYRYLDYKSGADAAEIRLFVSDPDATDSLRGAIEAADVRADVTNWTRDLVNTPPDAKMPAALADRIAEAAEAAGLRVEVWDEGRIEAEGMGGLLGVNRGSLDPPRFVTLEWAPEGTEADAPVVLVGKTVTYDTGGLSLKPTKDSMDKMKADMAGGAAVAGALVGAARLGLPVRVVGLLPMSDNRPGGRAFAPGDVLTMHSGTTVEVMNTDAEGRLLLADALSHARSLGPRWVLDAATLTGAQGIALGERVAAVIARPDEEAFAGRVRRAGERTGDLCWPLPLYPHYADQLESDVADLSNIGGRMAGTITAGAFLEHFTRDDDGEPAYPWAHVDLARPAFLDSAYGYRPKGASGFGVRLLLDLLGEDADG